MKLHLEFTPRLFDTTIDHHDNLLLIGSCFTENIGTKLKQHKFSVLENPNGILFNPISIAKSISSYIENKKYTEADLFYANESWNSWEHHSRFSHPDKEQCLRLINNSQTAAHEFLKTADWVLITVGSAFVYELYSSNNSPLGDGGKVVANCHKIPTDKFNKKLLSVDEVYAALSATVDAMVAFNPKVKVIYTISPVRHLRDGFVENNRSKSTLIQAVHRLVDAGKNVFYFPAYELVIDDLRDYRFYAEDMVHPNYAATNYVWDKFVATCISTSAQQLMEEINIINAAKSHKPFNPTSEQHKKFLQKNLALIKKVQAEHSYINFEEEMIYFNS